MNCEPAQICIFFFFSILKHQYVQIMQTIQKYDEQISISHTEGRNFKNLFTYEDSILYRCPKIQLWCTNYYKTRSDELLCQHTTILNCTTIVHAVCVCVCRQLLNEDEWMDYDICISIIFACVHQFVIYIFNHVLLKFLVYLGMKSLPVIKKYV